MLAPGDLPADQGNGEPVIPVDYFVESALCIIEHSGSSGIYHITSDNPPDMTTLLKYSERFLGLRGIRAVWDPSGKNPAPIPAEELFDRFIEPYRPYLSDRRIFDRSRTKSITPGLSTPAFTYEIFERCMDYAVACDWGNVYDLKTGTLIWSGEGRSIVSLEAFFNFYGSERTKQLQGICCDMWPDLNTDMVTDNFYPPEFTDAIFKIALNMPFV